MSAFVIAGLEPSSPGIHKMGEVRKSKPMTPDYTVLTLKPHFLHSSFILCPGERWVCVHHIFSVTQTSAVPGLGLCRVVFQENPEINLLMRGWESGDA